MKRILVFATIVIAASTATAKPAYKRELAAYLGSFLPAKVNDCRVCHVKEDGGEGEHNAFGSRIKAIGKELRKAEKEADIQARLEAIADEDADGDGTANLLELVSGHFPGDKGDAPTADEFNRAKGSLTAFLKVRPTYRWKPYTVVVAPPVPRVEGDWGRNPIDAFLAAEHAKRNLKPRPEADRATLLRRATLDLTGLPPTEAELREFLSDTATNAYEKAIDRLLDSPRYGERWGRHWMDVWRYSDAAGWSDGNQIRDSHPHVWRWRDWIVESLNADKGYDQMIREMLAADELAPDDTDALRATGFLVRNYKMLSREKWLQDTVDHTFLAFQATTVGCSRCHDHFYDPLKQEEYYRVRAVFEPHQVRIDRVPGQLDTKLDGLSRVFDADANAKTFLLVRGDERTPEKTPLEAGVPAALGGKFAVQPVTLSKTAVRPDHRDFVRNELLAAAKAKVEKLTEAKAKATPDKVELAQLDLAIASAERESLEAVLRAEVLDAKDPAWKAAAEAASMAQRKQKVAEAEKALAVAKAAKGKIPEAEKALAAAKDAAAKPPTTEFTRRDARAFPETSTGRRLAFANWLAAKDNPLTARVAVNHIWLRHFGQAIVPSVFDFGKNGRPATHPALLDWLAAEFMRGGWKMKPFHRLIVTSRAYRMASTPDAENLTLDRDNVYFWRMAPRRLEAEAVRDQLLFVAGALDPKMSGPELSHLEGMTKFRRSIYFRTAAEKQVEFLKIFNCASVTECYERKESIGPQQALALQNNPLAIMLAGKLAAELNATATVPDRFVEAAFLRILGRSATAAELSECVAFLQGDGAGLKKRESLVLVLFNHHEFVTIR